jgi:hypothetical protein
MKYELERFYCVCSFNSLQSNFFKLLILCCWCCCCCCSFFLLFWFCLHSFSAHFRCLQSEHRCCCRCILGSVFNDFYDFVRNFFRISRGQWTRFILVIFSFQTSYNLFFPLIFAIRATKTTSTSINETRLTKWMHRPRLILIEKNAKNGNRGKTRLLLNLDTMKLGYNEQNFRSNWLFKYTN